MTSTTQTVYGIDLGTTYSAIAHVNEFGQAEVIDNLEGDKTTPSVVYFEDADNFIVGKIAKNGQKVFPADTVSLVKRLMGQELSIDFHGRTYTPESISALILRQLTESAQEMTSDDSNSVVITVPAYFGLVEKEATRTAGEIAGLDVRGIIAEPIAAALSVGIRPGVPQNVFVYDLGGGTFDCTVMSLNDDGISVLAVDGDRALGGADWDNRLFDLVLGKFTSQAGIVDDPSLDDEFTQDLLSGVEEAKKALTRKSKTRVRCSYLDTTEMVEITREEFEEVCTDLVQQTVEVARRTLAAAMDRQPNLIIDKYLLVGGSSRMPMIQNALTEQLGWMLTPTEFDLAVAKGAAIYGQGAMDYEVQSTAGEQSPVADGQTWGQAPAAPTDSAEYRQANPTSGFPAASAASVAAETSEKRFLAGAEGNVMTINNLLSKSVGVRFKDLGTGENYVGYFLNQGDSLPAEATVHASTAQSNTSMVEVHIYEQTGEVPSREMEANKEITPSTGAQFTDLPHLPQGAPIDLHMTVDSEGLLTFEGYEPSTQQMLTLEVRVATMQQDAIDDARDMVAQMVRGE